MTGITRGYEAPFTVGAALDGWGWHPAAWRDADSPEDVFTAAYWSRLVEIAERGGLDYVTLEDALHLQDGADEPAPVPTQELLQGRLDALLTASWIAPGTRGIGLIPTVTVTHTEPFHVATWLQTLDHISLGRAGWQLRISSGIADAAAFGRRTPDTLTPEALLAEATEVNEVVRALWDSWEDDAVIRDLSTGRFLDRDRLHYVDFVGDRFSVKGPSIVPRSPQGQPPVTVAARTAEEIELAARTADVVFVAPPLAGACAGADDLVRRVRETEARVDREALGLAPLRVVADLAVALDGGAESGSDRLARLDARSDTPAAGAVDAAVFTGGSAELAALVSALRRAGIDGVRLLPLSLPHDLVAVAEELLPLLRETGTAGTGTADARSVDAGSVDGPAPSLRERFGLQSASNRFASARERARVAPTLSEVSA